MKYHEIDIIIDKLTNSIENRISGEVVHTTLLSVNSFELATLRKEDWLFDWSEEIRDLRKQVFKLCVRGHPHVIEGLISLEIKADHVFVHLAESSSLNRGANKVYLGVAGNLFAFACQLSIFNRLGGFVAFDAKTALIDHYVATLGATRMGGQRMYIGTSAAIQLVQRYLND
jgi:hypothetical protein